MNVWTALAMEVFGFPMTTVQKTENPVGTKFDIRYWFETKVTINENTIKLYDCYQSTLITSIKGIHYS